MLKIAIVKRGASQSFVTLKGRLEENAGFVLSGKVDVLAKQNVVFDCAGIESVNSVGMRHWIEFLKQLAKASHFEFENCSVALCEMMNLLPTTSYSGHATSVQVPYVCQDCDTMTTPVFEADALRAVEEFDPMICAGCNGTMEAQLSAAVDYAFLRPETPT